MPDKKDATCAGVTAQQHGYCHETKSTLKTGAEFERKDKCTDKKLERFKAHGRRKEG